MNDSLALLQFVHPLEWPYSILLEKLSNANDLPMAESVLEQYLNWIEEKSIERLSFTAISAVLSLHAKDRDERTRGNVQKIRSIVKTILQSNSEPNLRKAFVEPQGGRNFYVRENSDQENLQLLHEGSRVSEEVSSAASRTLDDLCAQLLQVLPVTDVNANVQEEFPKSKWIDPESPENLNKFISEISQLGNPDTEWSPSVVMSPDEDLHITPVLGLKRAWKKNLRTETQRE